MGSLLKKAKNTSEGVTKRYSEPTNYRQIWGNLCVIKDAALLMAHLEAEIGNQKKQLCPISLPPKR